MGTASNRALNTDEERWANNSFLVRNFYHLPQVHDGNPVADIVHSPQSVADKNTGKSQLLPANP